jgi:chromosome condensin MukBEF ATPase and DNA-binding subunit MukB
LQCLNSELKDQLALSSETSDKVSQELQDKLNQQLVDARREKALYEQKITFLEMEMKELEEKSLRDV